MPGLNSIEGLASGLNTTEIINATITLERQPAVLVERERALRTQELTTFKSLSAKILALENAIRKLNSKSAFSQASIFVSDEAYLSASATDEVTAGSYNLNVLALAQNHQIASQGFDELTQTIFGKGTISLKLGADNPTIITIEDGQNSLIGIKNAINDADIGVSASIVNDGSSSNPYRLILTGNRTGATNTVSVSSSLTGGLNLDFDTSSFDAPEEVSFSSATTSAISLGATAAYTGSTNKTFTFTVDGSGTQTVGMGNIVLNWVDSSDPTNTGQIVVDQADTSIDGPEGLKLSFTSGDLAAGDSFQVTAFAPLLQQASNAKISVGSSVNGASPITISSDTNTFADVIPGVTIDANKITTDESGPITVKTGLNVDGVKDNISDFISAYNGVLSFIDSQNEFDAETSEGGVLLGDSTVQNIQARLKRMILEPIAGLDREMNTLSAIGIRTNSSGELAIRNDAKLTKALEENFEGVLKLFVDGGSSSVTGIEFISAESGIEGGAEYVVDITQAATQGYMAATSISDPATSPLTLTENGNKLKLRIDGLVSGEIGLTARTYTSGEDLAQELQTRINNDDKIGDKGVSVEWVHSGLNKGYLKISSASYGSQSKVGIVTSIGDTAYSVLGFIEGQEINGKDVIGTINGEEAEGKGQLLIGKDDNATTAGLQLKVTLTSSQLSDGDEGTISITRGLSSIMGDGLGLINNDSNGIIARKERALKNQIEDMRKYIEEFDERLIKRRERLQDEWTQLEVALSNFQSQSTFLTNQLKQVEANTNRILGNN